jgi:hypothetical protein
VVVYWFMCVSEIITGEGMQEPRAVRRSNPLWPRVMVRTPQGVWVSVDRGTDRPAIELRKRTRLRRPTGI